MIKFILKSLDLVHSTIVSILFQKITDILNQLSVIQNTPFLRANMIFIKKLISTAVVEHRVQCQAKPPPKFNLLKLRRAKTEPMVACFTFWQRARHQEDCHCAFPVQYTMQELPTWWGSCLPFHCLLSAVSFCSAEPNASILSFLFLLPQLASKKGQVISHLLLTVNQGIFAFWKLILN